MRWIPELLTMLVLSLWIQPSVADQLVRVPLTRRMVIKPPPRISRDGLLNSVNVVASQARHVPGTLRTFVPSPNTSFPVSNARLMSSLVGAESQQEAMNNYFTLVYTARISLGTPAQDFDVVFDTGSADLWVIDKNNPNGQQSYLHYFDAGASRTFQTGSSTFQVQYGTGNVQGANAREMVTLLGLRAPGCWFGLVTQVSSEFQNSMEPIDGILGLGFGSIHGTGNGPNPAGSDAWFPTVVDVLQESNVIPNRTFSFVLDPTDGGNSSVFIVGGIPPDIAAAYAPRGFVSLPVAPYQGVYSYWYVPMLFMSVGDNSIVCPPTSPCMVMLDTGTSFLVTPSSVFTQFWYRIRSTRSDCFLADGIPTQVWCTEFTYDNLPLVNVTFGGSMFVMYPSDYAIVNGNVLVLGLTGTGGSLLFPRCPSAAACFIFGDVFLKQHYTVFDMDDHTIQIAKDYPRERPNIPTRPLNQPQAKSNAWLYILIIVFVVCGVIGSLVFYRLRRKRQAYLQSEGLSLQNAGVPENGPSPLSQCPGGFHVGCVPATPAAAQPDRQLPLLSDASE